jgi:hypothetical protein
MRYPISDSEPEDDLPVGVFPEAHPESCYHALRQHGLACTRLNAELFYEMGQIQRNRLVGCTTEELRDIDLWDQLSGLSLWDEPLPHPESRLITPEKKVWIISTAKPAGSMWNASSSRYMSGAFMAPPRRSWFTATAGAKALGASVNWYGLRTGLPRLGLHHHFHLNLYRSCMLPGTICFGLVAAG